MKHSPHDAHVLLRETLRIDKGQFLRLNLHHDRIKRSAASLGRRALNLYELETALAQAYYSFSNKRGRDAADSDRLRCRITYNEFISNIEIESYAPRRPRVLVLADAGELDYVHKYADRGVLDSLKERAVSEGMAAMRARPAGTDFPTDYLDADWDVLLCREGLALDVSYANIAVEDEDGWLTPSPPLLPGVRRQAYLSEGRIREAPIAVDDLIGGENADERASYRPVRLRRKMAVINAMLDLEDEVYVEWLLLPPSKL